MAGSVLIRRIQQFTRASKHSGGETRATFRKILQTSQGQDMIPTGLTVPRSLDSGGETGAGERIGQGEP